MTRSPSSTTAAETAPKTSPPPRRSGDRLSASAAAVGDIVVGTVEDYFVRAST